MIIRAEEMIRDVRVAIDMNHTDNELLRTGDSETLELDEIIRAKLCDAERIVETEAPVWLLESGHSFGERHVYIGTDGKGYVILPEDFMRLVSFRMNDWQRTVYEAISASDPEYERQSSKWKGVCGNTEKPVVAIVRRAEGKVLEFYSSRDETARVAQASYIPYPRIDPSGGIDVSEGCYRSAVYRAAGLALASVGDQLSGTMIELSRAMLQG